MLSVEQFFDPTVVTAGKLILAMLLGTVIGTERAILAKQSAGMRTFGIVALGSCLFIVVANAVSFPYIGIMNFDPLRTAAAIITGIGFLGAGLIIFRHDTLHGITTAAGLWVVAGIGMAVGFGLYTVAIFSTILVLLMFTAMWYVENRFKHWFEEVQADTGGNTFGR
ncbi:MgtC/SapB family protein [Candidatus Parcubacteria bacterium]|nr:MAG: MgtC/SapB family protein [Candidatus Parcubacteria bacterium]